MAFQKVSCVVLLLMALPAGITLAESPPENEAAKSGQSLTGAYDIKQAGKLANNWARFRGPFASGANVFENALTAGTHTITASVIW